MSRLLNIAIDTVLNSIRITDSETATGDVFLDYNGKIGALVNIKRRLSSLPLTHADAKIKFDTPDGSTAYFAFAEIQDVTIDAVSIGAADLADVISGIGAYLFQAATGGDPVSVTDTDMTVYEVDPGDSFTCTIPSALATFNFATGSQYKVMHRMGFAGSITGESLTNIEPGYSIWKNKVLITPLSFPIAISQGDILDFAVTATNPAANASIALTISGIGTALTFNSRTYHYPTGSIFSEGVTFDADYLLETDLYIKGAGSSTADRSNVIFNNPLTGAFEVISEPSRFAMDSRSIYYGLNDQSGSNTPATRYTRQRYCIRAQTSSIRAVEANVVMATVAINYSENYHLKISSEYTSPGVYTIKYWYSIDNMATWVLIYTSLNPYNGTTPLYLDMIMNTFYYGALAPAYLKQL